MEIIKNNYFTERKISDTRDIECEHCDSLLSVNKSDIFSDYMYIMNEVNQPERGWFDELVMCPCCNKKTRLVPRSLL